MPITRRQSKMTEEELLALQAQIKEREKKLLDEARQLELNKKQAETAINNEWEKLRRSQGQPDPNLANLIQKIDSMQSEINKLAQVNHDRESQATNSINRPSTSSTLPIGQLASRNSDSGILTGNISTLHVDNRENSIGLKDVLNTIPNFNGQEISVFHFSRACERARDMLPRNLEFSLVQLIINKLKGHAYQLVQDQDFKTITELITLLKNTFAPQKTANQYRGELGNLYQGPLESVMDYAGRTKDLKAGLIDCELQTRGNISADFKREIDREIIESFVNGLKPQTRVTLRLDGYTDLNDAVAKAVRIAKTLADERKRYDSINPPRGNRFEGNRNVNNYGQRNDTGLNANAVPYVPARSNENTNQTTPKTCSYCGKLGHEKERCFKLTRPGTSQQNNQGQINFLGAERVEADAPSASQTSN